MKSPLGYVIILLKGVVIIEKTIVGRKNTPLRAAVYRGRAHIHRAEHRQYERLRPRPVETLHIIRT